jgi:hypothetical protein
VNLFLRPSLLSVVVLVVGRDYHKTPVLMEDQVVADRLPLQVAPMGRVFRVKETRVVLGCFQQPHHNVLLAEVAVQVGLVVTPRSTRPVMEDRAAQVRYPVHPWATAVAVVVGYTLPLPGQPLPLPMVAVLVERVSLALTRQQIQEVEAAEQEVVLTTAVTAVPV